MRKFGHLVPSENSHQWCIPIAWDVKMYNKEEKQHGARHVKMDNKEEKIQ